MSIDEKSKTFLYFLPLSGTDEIAVVDIEDAERVSQYCWHLDSKGYPRRSVSREPHIYLHTEILGSAEGLMPDHVNRNPLDNRRRNLRFITRSQNAANSPKPANNAATSKYKGVSWDKERKKWVASICHNDKRMTLGRFNSEDEAAIAYNAAAQRSFGDAAFLNDVASGDVMSGGADASTRKDEVTLNDEAGHSPAVAESSPATHQPDDCLISIVHKYLNVRKLANGEEYVMTPNLLAMLRGELLAYQVKQQLKRESVNALKRAELEGYINGVIDITNCRTRSSTTSDGANTLNELRAIGDVKIGMANDELAELQRRS